uniref:40S ribosomal protein S30 (Trinotate prediction) n=1 Tax=Henneguya salminicola TaxID=69463 RepID=A0A6G3MKP1_HENSL
MAEIIPMQIIIQSDKSDVFNVEKRTTINILKEMIHERIGLEIDDQVLVHSGRMLANDDTLEELGLQNLGVVSVFSKLLGGKLHGSLSRAGKVKNQTKKVPKTEKPKPKTGRCKQRLKYNRRFLATSGASAIPGRRRGPNSNSRK